MTKLYSDLIEFRKGNPYYMWQLDDPMTEIGQFRDGSTAYFVRWQEEDDEHRFADRYRPNEVHPPLIPIFCACKDGVTRELKETDFEDELYNYLIDGALGETEQLIRMANADKPKIGYVREGLWRHLWWKFYGESHICVGDLYPNVNLTWETIDHIENKDGKKPWISFAEAAKMASTFDPPSSTRFQEWMVDQEDGLPEMLAHPTVCMPEDRPRKYIWEI